MCYYNPATSCPDNLKNHANQVLLVASQVTTGRIECNSNMFKFPKEYIRWYSIFFICQQTPQNNNACILMIKHFFCIQSLI